MPLRFNFRLWSRFYRRQESRSVDNETTDAQEAEVTNDELVQDVQEETEVYLRTQRQLAFQREFVRTFRTHASRGYEQNDDGDSFDTSTSEEQEEPPDASDTTDNYTVLSYRARIRAALQRSFATLLSHFIDGLALVIVSVFFLRIFKNLINLVTFSNDYVADVFNYMETPTEILLYNDIDILEYSKLDIHGKLIKPVVSAVKNSPISTIINKTPTTTGMVSHILATSTTTASSSTRAASHPHEMNTISIIKEFNGHEYVILNNLLLKFSNSILSNFPIFFRYPQILKVVTILLYGLYCVSVSEYLIVSFLFFIICLVLLSTRKWYEINKFFLKILEESNGVF
ncbi:hypothetical protein DASC09_021330 [Saccharomycopsis crataegensis]|uniref:Uncharacterized protein n=1 Tax=Saccharomycopsis crataegensis TaxID=43959 RepID=A0AAV5QJ55_9ASCO|nr:hypothetical protein DASC09_021330 [Saccharomycopsis crataegensis]